MRGLGGDRPPGQQRGRVSDEEISLELPGSGTLTPTSELGDLQLQLRALEHRFTGLEHRFTAIEGRSGGIEGRLGSLEPRFGAQEERMSAIPALLVRVAERIEGGAR
jgi:hypothetical protein